MYLARVVSVSFMLVFLAAQPAPAAIVVAGGAAVVGEDIGCSTNGKAPTSLTPNVGYNFANLASAPSGTVSTGAASVSWNITAAHVIASGSSVAGFPDVVGCAPVPPGLPFGFYGQQYDYGHVQFVVTVTLDGNYSYSGTSGSGILGQGTYAFGAVVSGGGALNVPGFPINPGPSFSIDVSFSPSLIPPTLQTNGKSLGSGCSGSCPVGNPIDVGSGNKYETIVDYHTSGSNQLSFARYYNSLAMFGTLPSPLGNNWRSTYDRYLNVISSGGAATAVSAQRANGQVLNFTKSGGNWASDSDVDVQLVQTGATAWTLTDHDDTMEIYAVNVFGEGLLASIQSRNGYTQTLQYNTANQLTSVTDTYNRVLSLAYSGELLQTVTTPDGLVLTYAYTAATGGNQLTSVSYSTTPITSQTYLYENTSLPFALTGIVDEDGNRYATWTYYTNGRGLTSQHAGGADLTTISYNDSTGSRTVTNALGQQMVYQFATLQSVPKVTEIDRLATSTTAAAKETFTYDSNGYTASVTDWNGNLTTFVNDVHGQPTTIVEASGTPQARTTTTTYLSNFHLPVSVATPGIKTTFTYDANGNPLTRTDTDTTSTSVPYSTGGNARTTTYAWANFLPASVQGPRTDVTELTTYTYDSTGALTGTTNALNQTTKVTKHLPGGLPETILDPNSVTTNLVYDARNRLLSSTVVTAVGSLVISYAYDAAGNVLTLTQPDGSSLSNTYDAAHRLTKVSDLFHQSISYSLDTLGDRTQTNVADATGKVQHTHSDVFDALGRVLQDIGGVGQTTAYTYDGDGNALTVTDPLEHQTQQAFDALNRPVTTTDPAGNVTHSSYDAHDRLVSVTDPNGGTTAYTYDGFGDLIQQVSPTSGTTVYRYDPARNLLQRVDARGVVANFTYDALDRVATTAYPGDAAENITYTYDQAGHGFGVGRLTSVADAAGMLSRSYDERSDVLSTTRVQGGATLLTTYGYDGAQRIASIGYPSGLTASYTRDGMGRITAVTTKAAGTTTPVTVVSGVGYEPFGPPKVLTFGNGVIETRTFDADYRETLLSDAGKSPVQQLGYSYDLTDNVSSITDSVTATNSQTFGYDVLNRLTAATGGYGMFGYTYDAIGNRLSDTPSATLLVLDGLGSINSLVYNQAGRVSAVNAGTNQVAGYTYDAFGHRLARSGANAALYQYDLSGRLLEETNGQATPQADYIYLGDQPIASVSPVSGNMYFLQDDRLGTPQVATDVNQTEQWTANYQPFGFARTGAGSIVQDLRLPGQEFDSVAGWNHNGFREYAPGLGRYLASDPIGLTAGLNTYAYAKSSPLVYTDRTGLQATLIERCVTNPACLRLLFFATTQLVVANAVLRVAATIQSSPAVTFLEENPLAAGVGASLSWQLAPLPSDFREVMDTLSSLPTAPFPAMLLSDAELDNYEMGDLFGGVYVDLAQYWYKVSHRSTPQCGGNE